MTSRSAYEFGRDAEREQARLAAVESAFDPVSQCFLLEAGAQAGWRCWEVGAGNGSIARWLAGVVGAHGEVLATDLDDGGFDAGDTAAVFVRHDIAADPLPADGFDLVHARFLLEHLPDPRVVIARLRDALRPGGVLVLEDSSGLRLDVVPGSPELDRIVAAWEVAGRAVGWAATYGQRLMADLRAVGLSGVRGLEHRRVAPGGPSWVHLRHGLERLREELIDLEIDAAELRRAIDCLADPDRLISGPPVLSAYGRR